MNKKDTNNEVTEIKKRSKKLIVAVVLITILILGSGSVIAFSMITETPVGDIISSLRPVKPDEIMVLNEFLVNAASTKGQTNKYLRINIALTHKNNQIEVMKTTEPIIRDIILGKLKSLEIEDLLDDKRIDIFKEVVQKDLNEYFKETHSEKEMITGVYITDLIIK